MDAYRHDELRAALQRQSLQLNAFFSSIPMRAFFDGSDEAWSPAHHVQHLIMSVTPLARGLQNASRLPATPEGTVSRTFTEVRDAYLKALGKGVPPVAGFAPTLEPVKDREKYQRELSRGFSGALVQLSSALEGLKDDDLDKLAIPHPLLGPLTVREMVLFTIYHNQHHEAGIRKRIA